MEYAQVNGLEPKESEPFRLSLFSTRIVIRDPFCLTSFSVKGTPFFQLRVHCLVLSRYIG